MQKEKPLSTRNGPQPIRIESLPLNEALKVLDVQGRAQIKGGSVRIIPLAEELIKSKKVTVKDKKDQVALNNFYRVFSIWACERAKAYHRAKYPNGQIPRDEHDIDAPTRDYYQAIHDQIMYVVQEQNIFKPEFLAMRVGFEIRTSVLKQIAKLKRDPREQRPRGYGRQDNTLPHREQMYSEILNDGLKIHQAPFWDNCGFDELRVLYAKYRYPRYTFTYKGQPIIRRLTMGKKYMMVLKQTPESKYSARGLGMQSALGHPSKSIKFKKYELPWSNTPIRIGEMELMGLCMDNDPESIAIWLSTYANSLANREAFVTSIIQAYDPFDITISVPERRSINRKMLNCLFKSGGARLE